MDTRAYRKSSGGWLRVDDVDRPRRVKISKVEERTFQNSDDVKLAVRFEDETGLTLNNTNLKFLQDTYGFDSDDWLGRNLVLFRDNTVEFNGRTGSLRLREPDPDPVSKPEARAEVAAEVEAVGEADDTPF